MAAGPADSGFLAQVQVARIDSDLLAVTALATIAGLGEGNLEKTPSAGSR
jgi:hypothetical protein